MDYPIFVFINPLTDGLLVSFQILATVNNATMNTGVQDLAWKYVLILFGICLGVEFLDHMATAKLCFQSGWTILYFHQWSVVVIVFPAGVKYNVLVCISLILIKLSILCGDWLYGYLLGKNI